eukprot:4923891-Prymnesium_polylepis.1
MTVIGTHAVRRISSPLQRAVRSDTEHATCDSRHKTAARAASFMHLSRPVTQQTIPDPPKPTLPHKA